MLGVVYWGVKFGTVINCIDGRVQLPVNKFLCEKFGLDYIDTVTGAGIVGLFAGGGACSRIFNDVKVSVVSHGSRVVAVCAHADCAGNAVSDDEQIAQIKTAVGVIKSWGFGVDVVGLWAFADAHGVWRCDVVNIG